MLACASTGSEPSAGMDWAFQCLVQSHPVLEERTNFLLGLRNNQTLASVPARGRFEAIGQLVLTGGIRNVRNMAKLRISQSIVDRRISYLCRKREERAFASFDP